MFLSNIFSSLLKYFIITIFFFSPGIQISSGLVAQKPASGNHFFSSKKLLICSWNLKDFGPSKSTATLHFVAQVIADADIVAIQEVVAYSGGKSTVASLVAIMNADKNVWAYSVSDITTSSSYKAERYAFIWKKASVQLSGNPWLEKKYNLEIDREPYLATFSINDHHFTLVNYHAITKAKQPEREIKYLKYMVPEYPEKQLIFLGDFNCPQTHTVFNPIKAIGYKAALPNQKTTLKKHCNHGDCLASAFDNFFYLPAKIRLDSAWAFYFHQTLSSFTLAPQVSDHLPIFFRFSLN